MLGPVLGWAGPAGAVPTTQRVSVPPFVETDGFSLGGVPRRDGSVVAFTSAATSLVDDDTSGAPDVFVNDSGTITRISVDTNPDDADWLTPTAPASPRTSAP
nr:hypothetical protein [Acidimicrobiia bacterium]